MSLGRGVLRCVLLGAVAMSWGAAASAQCWQWSPGFEPDVTGWPVAAFERFGASLYVAGGIESIGPVEVANIARWNGLEWSDLGGGVDGPVSDLAVFDDGSRESLIVAGSFARAGNCDCANIARWDGEAWHPIGEGLDGPVERVCVFDDGSGPTLYAGGTFALPFNYRSYYVARWDGIEWRPVGKVGALNNRVDDLIVFDDGTGSALYAAGRFNDNNGGVGRGIARWNGSVWREVGGGVGGYPAHPTDLVVYDDGSGELLYAGGDFKTAGSVEVRGLAKWDGAAWSAVGDNDHEQSDFTHLAVFDDGSGPVLYAASSYGPSLGYWDGESWTIPWVDNVYQGITAVEPLLGVLFVGGGRVCHESTCLRGMFAWDGSDLVRIGSGQGLFQAASHLEAFGDGKDRRLYVAGSRTAGSLHNGRLVTWDGFRWRSVGRPPINGEIRDLILFDNGAGNGEQLYICGDYGAGMARWDGHSWTALFPGLLTRGRSYSVFDDGGGEALFVGGSIVWENGFWSNLAKLDGDTWRSVPGAPRRFVFDTAVSNEPHDRGLYVAGEFTSAGGKPASNVARWDGAAWSALGGGLDHDVLDLCFFDDGGGQRLYAGGNWLLPDSPNLLSRWDGSSWETLVAKDLPHDRIFHMTVFDDGTGPALYVAGSFRSINGTPAQNVARWDGISWRGLGRGVQGYALAIAGFTSPTGDTSLYVGGGFDHAGKHRSENIARWFDGCLQR